MKQKLVILSILGCLALLAVHCDRSARPKYAAPGVQMTDAPIQAEAGNTKLAFKAPAEADQKLAPARSEMPAADASAGAPASAASAAPGPAPMPAMPTGGVDRYLIKNATVLVEVSDARDANTKLLAAVQTVGGYVGDYREIMDNLGRRSIMVQIRVPANRFDESMGQLDALGKVLNKQVTTQDVTEEFVDTDARSRNLKATEARLLDHLNRAGKLEDILRIEQEVTRVREEIERLDGRLRFLNDRVQYSTIQITLQEAPKAEPVVPAATFSTAKVLSEAVRSLVELGQSLWVRVIWWAVWSVVWVPCAVAVWLVYRRLRKVFKPIS
ncbi:MAG: DUF4349 domain-containing protein [Candidatus Hydrogenedentes bacterium]|nr:DUF4349 domain-containing protein [Candidatus Hydrogenedentota bacterium]